MFRYSFSAGLVCLWIVSSAVTASAQTPLKRATISALRNRVKLIPDSEPARKARISDVLVPGDALSTARASLAELRFNDGTLARMGEHAVFRFVPKTRRFRLSNGTVLLLIPPGKGRTTVKTPNVTAGIRGSALFVRYDSVTKTSMVGALTNSGIEVMNQDGTQVQPLGAGQMVVVVENKIQGLYDFDLKEFYSTSNLVKGLELDDPTPENDWDEAIAQVREETVEGLENRIADLAQAPEGSQKAEVLENPDFTALSTASTLSIADFPLRPEDGQLPLENQSFPGISIGNDAGTEETPDTAQPPALPPQLPVANPQPPVIQPPITPELPVAQPQIEPGPPLAPEPPIAIDPPVEPPIAIDPPVEPPIAIETPIETPAIDEIPVMPEPVIPEQPAPIEVPITPIDVDVVEIEPPAPELPPTIDQLSPIIGPEQTTAELEQAAPLPEIETLAPETDLPGTVVDVPPEPGDTILAPSDGFPALLPSEPEPQEVPETAIPIIPSIQVIEDTESPEPNSDAQPEAPLIDQIP